jgi:site-specific recombinase XerD
VPFFTSVELSKLERTCRGNTFAQRRDAAILAVFRASGIRLSELAGIRCQDVDLEVREVKVFGKRRRERIVKIDYEAARRIDRYLRVRARHEQASRSWPWLGVHNRGPLSDRGIYEMIGGAARTPASTSTRTGSGTISATHGWTAAGRKAT